MITTVTVNPAIDRTITLSHFEYGAVNRASSVREDIGGKGINVAKVLNGLGAGVHAIGFLGEDNAEQAVGLLQDENLETEFVFVPGKTRTNIKIIETATRNTTEINEAGFLIDAVQIETLKKLVRNYAQRSEFLVFSGSVPPGAGSVLYRDLLQSISDRRGLKTALDAENDLLLSGLEAKPFVIKPNLYELESALNRKLKNTEEIIEAARSLIRQFHIGMVLVSLGGEGSILVTGKRAMSAKALKVDVKGTVGAGDSMLAGYLYGLSEGYELKEALAWATVCGTLAVSKEGTQSFHKADAETLLKDVTIQEY